MKRHVQQRLLDLNRAFYREFARAFADSRSVSQAGLLQALAHVEEGMRVLDVGCGDGRAARALERMGRRVTVLGIDGSPELIALARERGARLAHVAASFALCDVAQPDWATDLPDDFDAILALALLHHMPGRSLRRDLMRQMASLLHPTGRLIVSTWQFLRSERLRQKIVPWERIGLAESQVEAGDHLLDWRRGGVGLRYCHLLDERELAALCHEAGLTLQETFETDGGLNLYGIATGGATP